MSLFSAHEPVFGLDIGHETLKVAVVSVHGLKGSIISQAETAIPKGAKTRQGIKDKDIIAQKIREARDRARPHRVSATECVSALPESLVFTKVMELPKMNEKEIAKAMPFQLTNAFPLSPDEAYFDWAVLGPGPDPERLEALVVAAPKILVDDFVEIVEKSGSHLVRLETKPVALTRLFGQGKKGGLIIVDIGAIVTGIDLIVNGNLQLTATVEVGAEHIKQSVDSLDVIADEIKNLVKYYSSRLEKKTDFNTVTLCGGGANLPNVPRGLQKLLEIPVATSKPTIDFKGYNPTYATAIGLAMRNE